jgi:hypothetical protein
VPQDINPNSFVMSAPVIGESPKVAKPSSPQGEKTVPKPLKPPCPKDARGSLGTSGAPPSPTHATSSDKPVGTSSNPKLAESLEASPPSPRSYGLGSAGGYQPGEGSSVPQSKK